MAVGKGLEFLEFIDDTTDARRRLYSLNSAGMVILSSLVSFFFVIHFSLKIHGLIQK